MSQEKKLVSKKDEFESKHNSENSYFHDYCEVNETNNLEQECYDIDINNSNEIDNNSGNNTNEDDDNNSQKLEKNANQKKT